MELVRYRERWRAILDEHSAGAVEKLTAILASAPATAIELIVETSYDEDGQGSFAVWARLEGPDSYVLNRPIDAHRELFAVTHTEHGLEPAVPTQTGRESFDLPDAVADTVADWVTSLHARIPGSPLPWIVDGAGGIGTTTPRIL